MIICDFGNDLKKAFIKSPLHVICNDAYSILGFYYSRLDFFQNISEMKLKLVVVLACLSFVAVGETSKLEKRHGKREIMRLLKIVKEDLKQTQRYLASLEERQDQVESDLQNNQPKTVYAQMQLVGVNSYKPGDRINFTSTVSNVGDAYDIHHGYFEAPCDGTYLFSVTLCTALRSWVIFRIVQDGNIIGEDLTGDSAWHACSSTTAVTQLKIGARVWVEIDRVHGGQIESRYGIPSFTGVFLNNYQNP